MGRQMKQDHSIIGLLHLPASCNVNGTKDIVVALDISFTSLENIMQGAARLSTRTNIARGRVKTHQDSN